MRIIKCRKLLYMVSFLYFILCLWFSSIFVNASSDADNYYLYYGDYPTFVTLLTWSNVTLSIIPTDSWRCFVTYYSCNDDLSFVKPVVTFYRPVLIDQEPVTEYLEYKMMTFNINQNLSGGFSSTYPVRQMLSSSTGDDVNYYVQYKVVDGIKYRIVNIDFSYMSSAKITNYFGSHLIYNAYKLKYYGLLDEINTRAILNDYSKVVGEIEKGIKAFRNGVVIDEINSNISVDTANIENLLSASNQYNQSVSDDISTIKDKVEESLIFENGFSETDSKNIESIRLFLIMCLMILSATYFRNVLAQWLRNMRVK